MYNNNIGAGTAGVTGGTGLAATGASPLWAILAAFAIIAVGTALLRIVPRRTR